MLHSLRSLKLFLNVHYELHIEVANKIMLQLPTSSSFLQAFDVILNLKRNHIMAILLFAYDVNTFGFVVFVAGEKVNISKKWVVLHLPTHTSLFENLFIPQRIYVHGKTNIKKL